MNANAMSPVHATLVATLRVANDAVKSLSDPVFTEAKK